MLIVTVLAEAMAALDLMVTAKLVVVMPVASVMLVGIAR